MVGLGKEATPTHLTQAPHAPQDEMFTLLSAILWLGNVQLKHKHARGGGDDTTDVVPGPALSTAARLLGVPEAALVKALSKRNISAGRRSYLRPRSLTSILLETPLPKEDPSAALPDGISHGALSRGLPGGDTCHVRASSVHLVGVLRAAACSASAAAATA